MAKTPLFTVFRAFRVFLKLQKPCEYQHFLRSTCQKCCNLQCFFAWLSKTLVFAVFSASRVQKVLVFAAFSAFFHCSRKRRQNARKAKNRPKNVSKRHFFPILGTLKTGGGNALGDAYERPGFRPKSSPPPSWRIFGVFRGPASEGRRLGAALP